MNKFHTKPKRTAPVLLALSILLLTFGKTCSTRPAYVTQVDDDHILVSTDAQHFALTLSPIEGLLSDDYKLYTFSPKHNRSLPYAAAPSLSELRNCFKKGSFQGEGFGVVHTCDPRGITAYIKTGAAGLFVSPATGPAESSSPRSFLLLRSHRAQATRAFALPQTQNLADPILHTVQFDSLPGDIDNPEEFRKLHPEEFESSDGISTRGAPLGDEALVEYAIVNDRAHFELVKTRLALTTEETISHLQTYAILITAQVRLQYQGGAFSPSINVVLTSQTVISEGSDPWGSTPTSSCVDNGLPQNGGEVYYDDMYRKFLDHVAADPTFSTSWPRFDVVHLYTGQNFCGNVIGWAGWLRCYNKRSGGVMMMNERTAASAIEYRGTLVAHEMGHNLGIGHDSGACDSGNVMSPTIRSGQTTFSTCSVDAFSTWLTNQYRDTTCFFDSPQASPTTEAPTTEAPTTEVPTTEVPTTEAPTTEAPTTQVPVTESPNEDITPTETPTEESTTEAPTQSPKKGNKGKGRMKTAAIGGSAAVVGVMGVGLFLFRKRSRNEPLIRF